MEGDEIRSLPKRPVEMSTPLRPRHHKQRSDLPMWQRLPSNAKHPLPSLPTKDIQLLVKPLGKSLHESFPNKEFDLNEKPMLSNFKYNSLNDPNLRRHFRSPSSRRHLVKRGLITLDGRVKADKLEEYNQYRAYLHHLWSLQVGQLIRHQEIEEKRRLHTLLEAVENEDPLCRTIVDGKDRLQVDEVLDELSYKVPRKTISNQEGNPLIQSLVQWNNYQDKLLNDYKDKYPAIRDWLNDQTKNYRNFMENKINARLGRDEKVRVRWEKIREHSRAHLNRVSRLLETEQEKKRIQKRQKEGSNIKRLLSETSTGFEVLVEDSAAIELSSRNVKTNPTQDISPDEVVCNAAVQSESYHKIDFSNQSLNEEMAEAVFVNNTETSLSSRSTSSYKWSEENTLVNNIMQSQEICDIASDVINKLKIKLNRVGSYIELQKIAHSSNKNKSSLKSAEVLDISTDLSSSTDSLERILKNRSKAKVAARVSKRKLQLGEKQMNLKTQSRNGHENKIQSPYKLSMPPNKDRTKSVCQKRMPAEKRKVPMEVKSEIVDKDKGFFEKTNSETPVGSVTHISKSKKKPNNEKYYLTSKQMNDNDFKNSKNKFPLVAEMSKEVQSQQIYEVNRYPNVQLDKMPQLEIFIGDGTQKTSTAQKIKEAESQELMFLESGEKNQFAYNVADSMSYELKHHLTPKKRNTQNSKHTESGQAPDKERDVEVEFEHQKGLERFKENTIIKQQPIEKTYSEIVEHLFITEGSKDVDEELLLIERTKRDLLEQKSLKKRVNGDVVEQQSLVEKCEDDRVKPQPFGTRVEEDKVEHHPLLEGVKEVYPKLHPFAKRIEGFEFNQLLLKNSGDEVKYEIESPANKCEGVHKVEHLFIGLKNEVQYENELLPEITKETEVNQQLFSKRDKDDTVDRLTDSETVTKVHFEQELQIKRDRENYFQRPLAESPRAIQLQEHILEKTLKEVQFEQQPLIKYALDIQIEKPLLGKGNNSIQFGQQELVERTKGNTVQQHPQIESVQIAHFERPPLVKSGDVQLKQLSLTGTEQEVTLEDGDKSQDCEEAPTVQLSFLKSDNDVLQLFERSSKPAQFQKLLIEKAEEDEVDQQTLLEREEEISSEEHPLVKTAMEITFKPCPSMVKTQELLIDKEQTVKENKVQFLQELQLGEDKEDIVEEQFHGCKNVAIQKHLFIDRSRELYVEHHPPVKRAGEIQIPKHPLRERTLEVTFEHHTHVKTSKEVQQQSSLKSIQQRDLFPQHHLMEGVKEDQFDQQTAVEKYKEVKFQPNMSVEIGKEIQCEQLIVVESSNQVQFQQDPSVEEATTVQFSQYPLSYRVKDLLPKRMVEKSCSKEVHLVQGSLIKSWEIVQCAKTSSTENDTESKCGNYPLGKTTIGVEFQQQHSPVEKTKEALFEQLLFESDYGSSLQNVHEHKSNEKMSHFIPEKTNELDSQNVKEDQLFTKSIKKAQIEIDTFDSKKKCKQNEAKHNVISNKIEKYLAIPNDNQILEAIFDQDSFVERTYENELKKQPHEEITIKTQDEQLNFHGDSKEKANQIELTRVYECITTKRKPHSTSTKTIEHISTTTETEHQLRAQSKEVRFEKHKEKRQIDKDSLPINNKNMLEENLREEHLIRKTEAQFEQLLLEGSNNSLQNAHFLSRITNEYDSESGKNEERNFADIGMGFEDDVCDLEQKENPKGERYLQKYTNMKGDPKLIHKNEIFGVNSKKTNSRRYSSLDAEDSSVVLKYLFGIPRCFEVRKTLQKDTMLVEESERKTRQNISSPDISERLKSERAALPLLQDTIYKSSESSRMDIRARDVENKSKSTLVHTEHNQILSQNSSSEFISPIDSPKDKKMTDKEVTHKRIALSEINELETICKQSKISSLDVKHLRTKPEDIEEHYIGHKYNSVACNTNFSDEQKIKEKFLKLPSFYKSMYAQQRKKLNEDFKRYILPSTTLYLSENQEFPVIKDKEQIFDLVQHLYKESKRKLDVELKNYIKSRKEESHAPAILSKKQVNFVEKKKEESEELDFDIEGQGNEDVLEDDKKYCIDKLKYGASELTKKEKYVEKKESLNVKENEVESKREHTADFDEHQDKNDILESQNHQEYELVSGLKADYIKNENGMKFENQEVFDTQKLINKFHKKNEDLLTKKTFQSKENDFNIGCMRDKTKIYVCKKKGKVNLEENTLIKRIFSSSINEQTFFTQGTTHFPIICVKGNDAAGKDELSELQNDQIVPVGIVNEQDGELIINVIDEQNLTHFDKLSILLNHEVADTLIRSSQTTKQISFAKNFMHDIKDIELFITNDTHASHSVHIFPDETDNSKDLISTAVTMILNNVDDFKQISGLSTVNLRAQVMKETQGLKYAVIFSNPLGKLLENTYVSPVETFYGKMTKRASSVLLQSLQNNLDFMLQKIIKEASLSAFTRLQEADEKQSCQFYAICTSQMAKDDSYKPHLESTIKFVSFNISDRDVMSNNWELINFISINNGMQNLEAQGENMNTAMLNFSCTKPFIRNEAMLESFSNEKSVILPKAFEKTFEVKNGTPLIDSTKGKSQNGSHLTKPFASKIPVAIKYLKSGIYNWKHFVYKCENTVMPRQQDNFTDQKYTAMSSPEKLHESLCIKDEMKVKQSKTNYHPDQKARKLPVSDMLCEALVSEGENEVKRNYDYLSYQEVNNSMTPDMIHTSLVLSGDAEFIRKKNVDIFGQWDMNLPVQDIRHDVLVFSETEVIHEISENVPDKNLSTSILHNQSEPPEKVLDIQLSSEPSGRPKVQNLSKMRSKKIFKRSKKAQRTSVQETFNKIKKEQSITSSTDLNITTFEISDSFKVTKANSNNIGKAAATLKEKTHRKYMPVQDLNQATENLCRMFEVLSLDGSKQFLTRQQYSKDSRSGTVALPESPRAIANEELSIDTLVNLMGSLSIGMTNNFDNNRYNFVDFCTSNTKNYFSYDNQGFKYHVLLKDENVRDHLYMNITASNRIEIKGKDYCRFYSPGSNFSSDESANMITWNSPEDMKNYSTHHSAASSSREDYIVLNSTDEEIETEEFDFQLTEAESKQNLNDKSAVLMSPQENASEGFDSEYHAAQAISVPKESKIDINVPVISIAKKRPLVRSIQVYSIQNSLLNGIQRLEAFIAKPRIRFKKKQLQKSIRKAEKSIFIRSSIRDETIIQGHDTGENSSSY